MRDTVVIQKETLEDKIRCPGDNVRVSETQRGSPVIRKFINSAIYVEKPISDTISNEDISVSQKYSNEKLIEMQSAKTKRCTCSVDQKTCPCHSNSLLAVTDLTSTSSGSKRVICSAVCKRSDCNTVISRTPITSRNDEDKDAMIKKWLAKKEEEKKKKEAKEKLLMEAKMKEREALLEQERNNFRKWLMNKKKQELEVKKKKQKELEEQQLKELEKEKRHFENQLRFQLWLKKKEEEELERKIKQQKKLNSELEKKEQKLRESNEAFNEWLKNSKNKQKPVPLNKGIQTLCSSSSITYINPNPWNPVP